MTLNTKFRVGQKVRLDTECNKGFCTSFSHGDVLIIKDVLSTKNSLSSKVVCYKKSDPKKYTNWFPPSMLKPLKIKSYRAWVEKKLPRPTRKEN